MLFPLWRWLAPGVCRKINVMPKSYVIVKEQWLLRITRQQKGEEDNNLYLLGNYSWALPFSNNLE